MTDQEKENLKKAFPFTLPDELFEPMTKEEFKEYMKFPPDNEIEDVEAHLCPLLKD